MSESNQLLRSPLHELSVESKAKFVDFFGWEMPIQYSGLKSEHQAVRNFTGIFDVSHMGKFSLKGENLISCLDFLVPSDLSKLKMGEAQYTVLLNEDGKIIDDIIFYYQGEDAQKIQQGVMIVNASTRYKDFDWLRNHLQGKNIDLIDNSDDFILIALQGKQSLIYLNPLLNQKLDSLPNFGHVEIDLWGETVFIARTGYTGEDGFEIMASVKIGQQLWQTLVKNGVIPCGLGARDTLRLEAAMCLYGQDIDETVTPLEAGLSWLVHFETKKDFIGRNALEKQKKEGILKRLVALEMGDRHIARHNYSVIYEGKKVGIITSGTFSPTLNKAIALAYVPQSLSKIGQILEVEIRDKNYPTKVVKKPFYRASK